MTVPLTEIFKGYTDEWAEAAAEVSKFTVFLCGPSPTATPTDPAVHLRMALKAQLEAESFIVVMGEDEIINNPEILKVGINLQDSEISFVERECNAIVLVAHGPGSFCELGLFSWHFSSKANSFDKKDFILLIDKKYEAARTYLNEGPAAAVNGAKGMLLYVDFNTCPTNEVIRRLRQNRGVIAADRRGRPVVGK